jgi:4-hydroxythreonine-4-phosphate dehydrogenase
VIGDFRPSRRAEGLAVVALTQGDPAGVGPEVALHAASRSDARWLPLLVMEAAALESVRCLAPSGAIERLSRFGRETLLAPGARARLESLAPGTIAWIDPVAIARAVEPGRPAGADARGALAALDLAVDLAVGGVADAIVTAPVSKAEIDRHASPGFRGHTDYLARRLGLERYGRDYLMAFLSEDLRVALLTVHQPLRQALESIDRDRVVEALLLLARAAPRAAGGPPPRIALAGLNPHAGEGGLLGREEIEILAPAVAEALERGATVCGPESPDTVFLRARQGEFDWVLALYHDQGLIAVKTVSFGRATNVTLGLPILRTSVDHGTAYALAGTGKADAAPMARAVETALSLLELRAEPRSAAST